MQTEKNEQIQAVIYSYRTHKTPETTAEMLINSFGLNESRLVVNKIINEVQEDVADWDFWTDVKKCLLC